ncbi:MAG: winged helix-turn-helix domain-containing protein [Candidatus Bathyarchaeota archaeon]|nr:winged helix-turn-helix domain-containing protein [Candidatus Bathyarchaeota archaeon]
MKAFESRFKIIKLFLEELESEPQSWTDLLMLALQKERAGISKSRGMLKFLVKYGLVVKDPLPKRRLGKYEITEKGRKMLNVLKEVIK